jgi:hypothetical protein
MSKQNPQPYKGNGQHLWEEVVHESRANSAGQPHASRLRVPGGWIYRVQGRPVFVPMPEVVKHKV